MGLRFYIFNETQYQYLGALLGNNRIFTSECCGEVELLGDEAALLVNCCCCCSVTAAAVAVPSTAAALVAPLLGQGRLESAAAVFS